MTRRSTEEFCRQIMSYINQTADKLIKDNKLSNQIREDLLLEGELAAIQFSSRGAVKSEILKRMSEYVVRERTEREIATFKNFGCSEEYCKIELLLECLSKMPKGCQGIFGEAIYKGIELTEDEYDDAIGQLIDLAIVEYPEKKDMLVYLDVYLHDKFCPKNFITRVKRKKNDCFYVK